MSNHEMTIAAASDPPPSDVSAPIEAETTGPPDDAKIEALATVDETEAASEDDGGETASEAELSSETAAETVDSAEIEAESANVSESADAIANAPTDPTPNVRMPPDAKLDLAAAKVSYQYCHETRLGYAEAYLTLGVKQLDKEALTEARTHFRRALEIKPQLIEAHNGLGITWACEGKLAEAHSSFFMAMEIRPGDARTLSNLGNAELALGMDDAALDHHQQAAELAPESPEILSNYGVALAAVGQWDAAIAALERAAQFVSGDRTPVDNLAMILESRGSAAEAMYWRGRSSERNAPPREPRALFTASGAWLARSERSLDGSANPGRANPAESAETHIHLGNALTLQGKDEAAANAFRRALKLDPDNFEANYSLAVALRNLNQHDEAREFFDRASELRPDSSSGGMRSYLGDAIPIPPPQIQPQPHPSQPPQAQLPTPAHPPSPSPISPPSLLAADPSLLSQAPTRNRDRDKSSKPKPAAVVADEEQLRAAVARTFGAGALQVLDDEETSEESLRRFLQVEAAQSDPQDLERLGSTASVINVRLEKSAAPASPPSHSFAYSQSPTTLLPPARTDGRALNDLIASIDREVEAAASARARDVRLKKKEASQSLTQRRLVFSLADFDFAMPMANVMEIQRPPRITSLPCLPDWLLGAASLRGDVIAVVDLRAFLGLDTIDIEQSGRILYARSPENEMTIGLVVDRVQGIVALAPEQIDRDRKFPDARVAPFIEGMINRPGSRPFAALSLERLAASSEMSQFQAGESY